MAEKKTYPNDLGRKEKIRKRVRRIKPRCPEIVEH